MFVNLKIDKINEILVVYKLLNTNKLKVKQTYIERLSFQRDTYFQVIWIHCERTLPLHCETTLEETVSCVDAGASSCLAPNDMFSSSLLEELAAIMCSRCQVDFSLCIYTILMNISIINFHFLKKKLSVSPLYWRLSRIFNPANIQNICHKPIDFNLFLPKILDYSISSYFQHDNVFNKELTRILCN